MVSVQRFTFALLLMSLSKITVAAETVWFEVAATDPQVAQSYLLPLSDPEQIESARAQVAERQSGGSGSPIVARIRPGGDGLNRNLRGEAQPLWSWHVAEFLEFGDLTIELCDGSPRLLEDDPVGFALNTGNLICFWGYTLAAELPEKPALAVREALDGFWHSPEANGTGFLIDVLQDQKLVALGWARYTATGGPEPVQQWLLGVGEIPADDDSEREIAFSMGQPAPSVDGVATVTPVAEVSIEFHDCNHATLTIQGDPASPLPLVRTVPRFDCNPHYGPPGPARADGR